MPFFIALKFCLSHNLKLKTKLDSVYQIWLYKGLVETFRNAFKQKFIQFIKQSYFLWNIWFKYNQMVFEIKFSSMILYLQPRDDCGCWEMCGCVALIRYITAVPTRVLNPNASEASYKPKQRSYRKTKLRKSYFFIFFRGDFGRGDFILEPIYLHR